MIPETDFHKRGNLMFAIVDGRYYSASNSADTENNFISLCGLRFPCFRGSTVADEEKAYVKRNLIQLGKRKEELELELVKGATQSEISQRFVLASDLNLFLKKICHPANSDFKLRKYQPQEIRAEELNNFEEEIPSLLPSLIAGNHVVVNGRLYPIVEKKDPFILDLNGKRFMPGRSELTVDDVETRYQGQMDEVLKRVVLKSSTKLKQVAGAVLNLEMENEQLINDLKVSKLPYAYESGEFGLDKVNKTFYCLIRAHYNQNTCKNYSNVQSAVHLTLNNGVFGGHPSFGDRTTQNDSFVMNSTTCCVGDLKCEGNTLEDKVLFLRQYAQSVADCGGIRFPIPTEDTSSSSDYSGYS